MGTNADIGMLSDEQKQKFKKIATDLRELFCSHPESAGETYWEHLMFTISMAGRFGLVSFIIFTHGVFPFLFTRTASIKIDKIYSIMKNRAHNDPTEPELEYEI